MPGLAGLKLYIGFGMLLLIMALGATAAVLWSRLDAKEAEIASLARQLEVASADARRWEAASTQRQVLIDRQALALRRLESDGAAARELADRQQEQARTKIAMLEERLSKLKEAAHARPDDVRELGPIVRDALQSRALGGLLQ